jgi:hypothetical protein
MAAGVLLAGCGGGGSTPNAESRAGYAREINLKASDVPGLVPGAGEYTARTAALPGSCPSIFKTVPGMVLSPSFNRLAKRLGRQVESIESSVLVMPTTTRARGAIATNHTARLRECLARSLAPPNGIHELVRRSASVTALPDPLPGVPSIALRLNLRLTFQQANPHIPRPRANAIGSKRELVGEAYAFASGPALVGLIDIHGPADHPSARERQLLRLLAARAAAKRI